MNRFTRLLAVLVMACVLLTQLPVPAVAQDTTDHPGDICQVVADRRGGVEGEFAERVARYRQVDESAADRVARQRETLNDKVAAARQKADAARAEAFKLMLDRQSDPEAAGAVETYRQAVEQAVTARRQADDAARDNFRQQIDTIRNNRRAEIEARTDRFRTAALEALSSAAAVCRRGRPDQAAIRSAVRSGLQSARLEFGDYRRTVGLPSEQIKAFIAERDKALESSRAAFEQAMQAARHQLMLSGFAD